MPTFSSSLIVIDESMDDSVVSRIKLVIDNTAGGVISHGFDAGYIHNQMHQVSGVIGTVHCIFDLLDCIRMIFFIKIRNPYHKGNLNLIFDMFALFQYPYSMAHKVAVIINFFSMIRKIENHSFLIQKLLDYVIDDEIVIESRIVVMGYDFCMLTVGNFRIIASLKVGKALRVSVNIG